jgi:outer membrane protein insertion porin family
VRVQVDAEADGLRVQFILEPAVYFGIFEFPGSRSDSHYSRLAQVASFQAQTPFNADDVEQDRQALVTFFRQQGYFNAEVKADVRVDEANGLANIFFAVDLKRQAKFGDIQIAGTSNEETASLDHSLQTPGARFRGAAIRPGRHYQFTTLSRAAQYMQARLQKQGRLGAEVKLAGAEYHADTNRADIHFSVKSGPTSQISIDGAHLWSWTRKSLLPVYQGIGVDDESVEEGRQALISYFQAKGFFDAKVDAQLTTEAEKNTVVYRISKESKHKVSFGGVNRESSSARIRSNSASRGAKVASVFSGQIQQAACPRQR